MNEVDVNGFKAVSGSLRGSLSIYSTLTSWRHKFSIAFVRLAMH